MSFFSEGGIDLRKIAIFMICILLVFTSCAVPEYSYLGNSEEINKSLVNIWNINNIKYLNIWFFFLLWSLKLHLLFKEKFNIPDNIRDITVAKNILKSLVENAKTKKVNVVKSNKAQNIEDVINFSGILYIKIESLIVLKWDDLLLSL